MVRYARRGFEKNAWIENTPEGLDSPGEWMVNTRTRKIYYWPKENRPGEDTFAPSLRELIIINACVRGNAGFIRALGVGEGASNVGQGLSNVERNIFYNLQPDRNFYSRHRMDDFIDRQRKRLFAIRILTGQHGFDQDLCMPVIGAWKFGRGQCHHEPGLPVVGIRIGFSVAQQLVAMIKMGSIYVAWSEKAG